MSAWITLLRKIAESKPGVSKGKAYIPDLPELDTESVRHPIYDEPSNFLPGAAKSLFSNPSPAERVVESFPNFPVPKTWHRAMPPQKIGFDEPDFEAGKMVYDLYQNKGWKVAPIGAEHRTMYDLTDAVKAINDTKEYKEYLKQRADFEKSRTKGFESRDINGVDDSRWRIAKINEQFGFPATASMFRAWERAGEDAQRRKEDIGSIKPEHFDPKDPGVVARDGKEQIEPTLPPASLAMPRVEKEPSSRSGTQSGNNAGTPDTWLKYLLPVGLGAGGLAAGYGLYHALNRKKKKTDEE